MLVLTFRRIQLTLDVIQHVADVDLSGVVTHHCLVGDCRFGHIGLLEVIHEALGIINVDFLDATLWQVEFC